MPKHPSGVCRVTVTPVLMWQTIIEILIESVAGATCGILTAYLANRYWR